MKRRHLLLIILLALGIYAMAAPLKNIEVRLTQPDGQVINCFTSGDEFYNYLHDANGFTIVQGENGYYVYATKDARGEVVASSFVVGTVDPATVGLQPYVKISENEYYARRHEWEQYIQKPQMRNGKELNHGEYNNLVVFIRFAGDTYHNTSFSTVEAMFNASGYEDVSLHNYYHHTSYNQLDLWSHFFPQPNGETIMSYEDINPKQYYQPYDPIYNPIGYLDEERAEREFSLLERAINYIEDMVPESIDLDYNSDGMVDNVVFVCKGETGDWNSLLWPHRWVIYDREVMLHGLRVWDFNLQLEQGGYFTVGTLCHEMFHSLGAPDLYHYSGGIDPVGSWDLMDGTSDPPQQTNAYMKYKYGNWIDEIPIIDNSSGIYELEPVSWEGGRRNGYMIPLYGSQYLFVEYRNRSDFFDNQIPGSGILIYRIDTRFDGNAGWNGSDTFDEVYLFRPNGTTTQEGEVNFAFFSEESKRTIFNNSSNPHPFLNPDNPYFDWGWQITNISKAGDRMRFNFMPYGGEGGYPGPENFVAHVNSLEHQVELSWNADPNAGYYYVYRDGIQITDVADTTFVHPYTEADNGFHIYSVLSVDAGLMHLYSAESKNWVILGNYETIDLTISCNSDYGTKGGELEVSFNHPDMEPQYFTIHKGRSKTGQLYVPANTEVTFRWLAGFDADGQGIHVIATKTNASGQETIFNVSDPTDGVLGTYTVPENVMGVIPAQNLTAVIEGTNIRLKWTVPVENNLFKVFRDDKPFGGAVSGYEYLDESILRSGTHNYHVESTEGNATSWNTDHLVYATVMNYYCEPPRNLVGTHFDDHNELQWEAPQFYGNGMIAYDDNVYVNQIGSSTQRWAIKIEPIHLATFEGHPLTHLEMFDCSAGTYTYNIYNGTNTNASNLIYTQQHEMNASRQIVRFPLDEAVAFDVTLPLWITVESTGAQKPIPCGNYIGELNSCLVRSGSTWKPAIEYNQYYSWLLRAYTSPNDAPNNFSYNVYWGPEEGGEALIELGFENLSATSTVHNSTENLRYNVTAIWNGRETEFSNTVYLGPSLEATPLTTEATTQFFPNPTNNQVTIQNVGMQHIAVFNILGQTLYEAPVDTQSVTLDLGRYGTGTYLVRILTQDGPVVRKILVTK